MARQRTQNLRSIFWSSALPSSDNRWHCWGMDHGHKVQQLWS